MELLGNIKEIYNKYINLEAKEMEGYIVFLMEQCYHNEEYIKKCIRNYVKGLSEEEQKKYALKQQELKEYRKSLSYLITNYIKTKSPISLLELLKISSSESINIYLDHYLEKNFKRVTEIEYLREQLSQLEQRLSKKDIYKKYLESGHCEQSIINLISLLFCNEEEEAILLLRRYSISKCNYNNHLVKFEALFPEQENDLQYLNNLYEKYTKYYHISTSIDDPFYIKNIKLIQNMVDSGYTVEEYISNYGGYTLNQMRRIFIEIRKLGILEYTHLLDILSSRDNQDFIERLKIIVMQIYEKDNFELLDYYEYTKLNIQYLKSFVLNHIFNTKVRDNVLYKLNSIFPSQDALYLYDSISLSDKMIINGRIISLEEQNKVLEFLKQQGILLIQYTFNYYLTKYVDGEIDLTTGKRKQLNS